MTSEVKIFYALCVLLNTLVKVQGYIFTVGPSADVPITKFESTFTVPPFTKPGMHFISAGLTNQAGNYTYENVLNDHNAGTWEVDLTYGSSFGATDNKILPGDKIYSVFEYSCATLVTTNNVTIIPGPESIKAGLNERHTSQQLSFQTIAPTAGKLNVARLRIDLESGAAWDFGPIVWENVIITSKTTDPWWCNNAWKASDDLNVTGRVTMFWGEDDKTNCEYQYMSFEPLDKSD